MNGASAATRALARHAVARDPGNRLTGFIALRERLVRVIGGLGFQALLERSVSLAKAKHPHLRAASADFAALEALGLDGGVSREQAEAFLTAVLTNLLLLVGTFIGETLTVRLLHEIWPELTGEGFQLTSQDEENR